MYVYVYSFFNVFCPWFKKEMFVQCFSPMFLPSFVVIRMRLDRKSDRKGLTPKSLGPG